MMYDMLFAVLQAATEFLPVSSSGHLVLVSNIMSRPDLYFFTLLHLASLVAVVIITRKEIRALFSFTKEAGRMWLYLITATIPAVLAGFFFESYIANAFSSLYITGVSFLVTGAVLLATRSTRPSGGLTLVKAFVIGICQMLALFPGISRSGMTISAGLFLGVDREQAARFSFLLFIPLALGAFILKSRHQGVFDLQRLAAFFVCCVASFLFLRLLLYIVNKGKLWIFSFYCFILGLATIIASFFLQ